MTKQSITVQPLYIKNVFSVIKSHNRMHHRTLKIAARHSDAFVYIISGSCTYTFADGKAVTANKGDVLYLAHNANYEMYIHDEKYRFIFCDFEFDCQAPRECIIFTPSNPSHTENLFIKLLGAYTSESTPFTDVLSTLYSIYSTVIKSQGTKPAEKTSIKRIEDAGRYIDFHFADTELSVSSLAETAGMSEVYFRRRFKEEYSQSPSEYILAVRLKKARELMSYPFLSIEDCAKQCGFSSQQYFSRVFKENMGVTPAKYRKNFR